MVEPTSRSPGRPRGKPEQGRGRRFCWKNPRPCHRERCSRYLGDGAPHSGAERAFIVSKRSAYRGGSVPSWMRSDRPTGWLTSVDRVMSGAWSVITDGLRDSRLEPAGAESGAYRRGHGTGTERSCGGRWAGARPLGLRSATPGCGAWGRVAGSLQGAGGCHPAGGPRVPVCDGAVQFRQELVVPGDLPPGGGGVVHPSPPAFRSGTRRAA